MASLWADYTFHETALSGLTVGAGARYIGNTVTYYSSASPKAYESFNVAGYAGGCDREIRSGALRSAGLFRRRQREQHL